ncbi:MAG: diaminobutyrate--2-oxoglutarate transaminase [Steroidobacteraceae bacterium]
MQASIFDQLESNVRSYCRTFPFVFERATGSRMASEDGREFIDFFAGAGALNYGHNNRYIKAAVLDYLSEDRPLHMLDMHTVAKREFLLAFQREVLLPGGHDYKVQFTGPTGTNAVEAALKIARRTTGKRSIWAFRGGYHGMSLGSLAITANAEARAAAGVSLGDAVFHPFPNEDDDWQENLSRLAAVMEDGHSGLDRPAAMIIETVQAEGGVNPAPLGWLSGLSELCRRHEVLLIVDDVQVGCYRTGTFFSFTHAGITPDIVVLSKSIGGIGLPMALVLMRPEIDCLKPGDHTGTFRGNQLAFVAGRAALEFARDHDMRAMVAAREAQLRSGFADLLQGRAGIPRMRGRGLIWGIDFATAGGSDRAAQVARECVRQGLIIERAGRQDTVLKILPALTIDEGDFAAGLTIIRNAMKS